MVSNTHSLKFLCCFADNIIAQFTIEILPAMSLIIGETIVRRISSPCSSQAMLARPTVFTALALVKTGSLRQGEVPAKQAERVSKKDLQPYFRKAADL